MANPLVSVIIPVFNRLQFLPATLESVRRQTLGQWEAWVVDDGSTEDVDRVLAAHGDPRIQLLRRPHRGNTAARNAGAALARADLLAFLDSDDCWEPTMLERCAAAYSGASESLGAVYTGWRYIDADGSLLSERPAWRPAQGDPLRALVLGWQIYPSAAVLRRSAFLRCGGFDERLDDRDLWLRMVLSDWFFEYIPGDLLRYRMHPFNLARQINVRLPIELETLDKLFARTDLPARVLPLRSRAYAQTWHAASVTAFSQGQEEQGEAYFITAGRAAPDMLRRLDTFVALAGARKLHEPGHAEPAVDAAAGERFVKRVLAQLGRHSDFPPDLLGKVRGLAHAAVGLVWFWHGDDLPAVRRHWVRAVRSYPGVVAEPGLLKAILQSLLGRRARRSWLRSRQRVSER